MTPPFPTISEGVQLGDFLIRVGGTLVREMRDYHELLDQIKIHRYHEYGYGDHENWIAIVGGEQSLSGMEIVSYGVHDLKSIPELNRIMAASNHLMICLYSIY